MRQADRKVSAGLRPEAYPAPPRFIRRLQAGARMMAAALAVMLCVACLPACESGDGGYIVPSTEAMSQTAVRQTSALQIAVSTVPTGTTPLQTMPSTPVTTPAAPVSRGATSAFSTSASTASTSNVVATPATPAISPTPSILPITIVTPRRPELALISDFGLLGDGSVTQSSWEALTRVASERDVLARHYTSKNQSVGAYVEAIDRAVEAGARVVVAPGIMFETPVWLAQSKYPDVKFILVDGEPHDFDYADIGIGENTAAIRFSSGEAGFLAGYAAVAAGHRTLGFVGAMAEPEIADAGIGFVKGAEYAARELALSEGAVRIGYAYTGTYFAESFAEALVGGWFSPGSGVSAGADATGGIETGVTEAVAQTGGDGGTDGEREGGDFVETGDGSGTGKDADMPALDLIFAAGGEIERLAADAAARAGRPAVLFGDPGWIPPRVSVVALVDKNYADALYGCVSAYFDGAFPGGRTTVFGAAEGCIGLRFVNSGAPMLSDADYVRTLAVLATGDTGLTRSRRDPYVPPDPTNAGTELVRVIMR